MNKKTLIFLIIIFIAIFSRLIYLNVNMKKYYNELLKEKTEKYIYGVSGKRGRILDRNGLVLVDNIGMNSIYYNNVDGITNVDKIEICYVLANIISIKEASLLNQKKFWLEISNIDLITEDEKKLYKERKITSDDLKNYRLDRIDISSMTKLDKKAAEIYYLINKDYFYNKKLIKSDSTDEEYAKVIEANLKGITGEITWKRNYLYQDTLKSIYGTIGYIPKERKEEYLEKGYALSDIVGLSYLEYQYDDYLKGEKSIYKVENSRFKLIKGAESGNDIYLNIDINIELELEKIVKKEMQIAKNKPNTEYFNENYASIADPKTGEIISLLGLRYNSDGSFSDITSNIISSSFTVGSVVKGATIAVGYNNNLITPGKYITDSCIKLYLVPQKCSFKSLGKINDISALAYSSNYYQFLIAIGLAGKKYVPNIKLGVTSKEFDIYRNTLASYGLGTLTGIDLPNEQSGIKGKLIGDDLLLNEAIGQYDTYTNIQLLQYINTVATGKRIALNLLNKVEKRNEIIMIPNIKVLNELEISPENLERVREGLKEVIKNGTGKTSANINLNPAGKTGTSESFIDSNNDGKMDLKTISISLALYYPEDDPKYSIAIISPNISHNESQTSYTYSITKHISSQVTQFLFENY